MVPLSTILTPLLKWSFPRLEKLTCNLLATYLQVTGSRPSLPIASRGKFTRFTRFHAETRALFLWSQGATATFPQEKTISLCSLFVRALPGGVFQPGRKCVLPPFENVFDVRIKARLQSLIGLLCIPCPRNIQK